MTKINKNEILVACVASYKKVCYLCANLSLEIDNDLRTNAYQRSLDNNAKGFQ